MLSLILYTSLAWIWTCAFIQAFPKGHKNPKMGQSCPFFLSLRHSNALCEFSGPANSSASKLIPHKPNVILQDFLCCSGDLQDHIFPNARHHFPDDPGKIKSYVWNLHCRSQKTDFRVGPDRTQSDDSHRHPPACGRMASGSTQG